MYRLVTFDSLKYFLIILVIIGHCIESKLNNPNLKIIYDYIYIFHMPLFMFLCGMFTSKSKSLKKIISDCLNLYQTYLIANLILIIINKSSISIWSFIFPQWGMWFIACLLLFRLTYYFLNLICTNNKKLFFIIFSFAVLVSLFSGSKNLFITWISNRYFYLLPFFLIGTYIKPEEIIKLRSLNKFFCFSVLVFIGILLLFSDSYIDSKAFHGSYSYHHFFKSNLIGILFRLTLYLLASVISICLFPFFIDNKFTQQEGKMTLNYYIIHLSLLSILAKLGLADNYLTILIVFFLIIIILPIINKYKITSKLFRPINFKKILR